MTEVPTYLTEPASAIATTIIAPKNQWVTQQTVSTVVQAHTAERHTRRQAPVVQLGAPFLSRSVHGVPANRFVDACGAFDTIRVDEWPIDRDALDGGLSRFDGIRSNT